MTTVSAAVEHPARRLIVHPSRPYDEAKELYELWYPRQTCQDEMSESVTPCVIRQ
jgi:hypothetical protein